ncbi:Gp49 family protein [Pseudomonas sp. MWU12-2345]|uniref:Gp49 family protein n=1 Tax=Pseudomonas sp. MWU12-2345 TaxID=2928689 RepID=UPI0020102408|nr:Gp49 family protein [Pseudomonas sp. MWU12-2345]
MNDNDQKYEAIIAALGLPGPRVTPAMVEEVLAMVAYDTRVIPGTTTTIAVAILPSGFVLATGMSACAARENFNPALGIEMAISKARDAAREAIWKFEGYRLSQALYEVRQGVAGSALRQIRSVLSVKGLPDRLVGVEQIKACLATTEGYTPHEVRVIHEKAELDDKADSLMRFFNSEVFPVLPKDERDRLSAQWRAMGVYSSILAERIAAFRPVPGSQDAGASQ